MGSRKPARLITHAAVVAVVAAFVALPVGPAFAEDPAPTTTTLPTPDTTTTTTLPPDTTTTLPPDTTTTLPPDTTTTVAPDTTTTTVPGGELGALGDLFAQETLIPVPEFASLTGTQRAVLQELQSANDALATRRFALVALGYQVASAKDALKVARVRERAAVERLLFGVLDAALGQDDTATQALIEPDTSDADPLAPAVTHAPSDVSSLEELGRQLESERKSAHRARVQAQAVVAPLNALLVTLTQEASDATAERVAAESAVTSAFGSDSVVRGRSDDITAMLATAQAGQPDPGPFAALAWPIPGARLGSPFGVRADPIAGGFGFHPGIDFDAGSGTPIHAAAAGVVVRAGDCGGYGYCVVIDHGSSIATVYAHQSELRSQVGDQVDAGEVIGLVGTTGTSTGPHLHYEVRIHGIATDPVLILAL